MMNKGRLNIIIVIVLIVILILAIGIGTYLTKSRTQIKSNAANGREYGWDYNLKKKCIKSELPNQQNYYQDTQECNDRRHWTTASQIETSQLGVSCIGPAGQSLPINSSGSPLFLEWRPHTDETGTTNWSVNLKTDMLNYSHPCGANAFTWFTFMDKIGPFPKPDNLKFLFRASYTDATPNAAIRVMSGIQVWWDGTGDGIPEAHTIDVKLYASPQWGDNYPNDYRISYADYPNEGGAEYIYIDGNQFGINLTKGQEMVINIPWNVIIQKLIDDRFIKKPVDPNITSTASVYVATEVNNFSQTNSALSDFWITDFRVEAQNYETFSPSPSSSLTPSFSPAASSAPVPSLIPSLAPSPDQSARVSPSPSLPSSIPAPVASPVVSKGDGNGDGKVDLQDLSILLSKWSPILDVNANSDLDFDNNKKINSLDYSAMRDLLLGLGKIQSR